jgi:hypothetical protein
MVAMVAIDDRTRPTPSPPPPRALNGTKAHGGEVRQNACTERTRRRQEPKPLGQQCPFPGLGKLDQDTRANLH